MNKKNNINLLIIGGTGFIGYHLAFAAKKKSWNVTSVSLHKPKKNRYVKGVKYLIADITNLKILKKKLKGSFTYVVNSSGYIDRNILKTNPIKMKKAHFAGLVNLTKVLSGNKIKKFIQIGSSAEYGKIKAPQNENNLCQPNSNYASAKLASTKFLLAIHKRQNFPSTILRLFQVYGPRQDQNRIVPEVIRGCLDNKKFSVTKGDQIRDFCYISDLVNAFFLIFKSKNTSGEIFNIGSGRPRKVKNVIKQICKIIGKGKPQFGRIKYGKNENMKVYPAIKKAKIMLGWKPTINFDEGIKKVISTFV